jgi:hypothetical protein
MALSTGLHTATDVTMRLREFTLTTYNNLPNTLFIASFVLGAIQGNLPMLWVSLGFVLNAAATGLLQELLGLIFPSEPQIWQPTSATCSVLPEFTKGSEKIIVSPSMWFSSTTYFVVFVFYNAVQVALRPANKGADSKKLDTRIAFSMSVIMLSVFFFALIMLRGFTGCETWMGSVLGIALGTGFGIGYWHLLDVCSSGIPPDILNIVAATAPEPTQDPTPVICVA